MTSLFSQKTDGGNFHWVVGKLKKGERTANISLTGLQEGDGGRFLNSLGRPCKQNRREDVAIPDFPTRIPDILVFRRNFPEAKQHQQENSFCCTVSRSLCSAFGFGNTNRVAGAPSVFVPHCLLQGSAWTATCSRSLLGVSGRICTGQGGQLEFLIFPVSCRQGLSE